MLTFKGERRIRGRTGDREKGASPLGFMKNVRVVTYDPSWPAAFEREAALPAGIFGEDMVAIYHIGSTSVPGLQAKPIIDIMPLVREIALADRHDAAMIEAGYEPRGENGIPGRRYYSKGGDVERTHHVHVFEAGSPERGGTSPSVTTWLLTPRTRGGTGS